MSASLALTNPATVAKVTGLPTEDDAHGVKRSPSRQAPPSQAALTVSHAQRRVTVLRHEASRRKTRELRPGAPVTVASVGAALRVDDLSGSVAWNLARRGGTVAAAQASRKGAGSRRDSARRASFTRQA